MAELGSLWSATTMNDTSASQAAGRRQLRLVVGDYVGQMAAGAAQAVRRTGLRPGLERSLGCEPEAVGHVLAQEPAAGSELARNTVVTLYVGAPGAAANGDQGGEQAAREVEHQPQAATEETPLAPGEPQVLPTERRRRKPRPPMLGSAALALDGDPRQQWIGSADIAPSEAPDQHEPQDEALDDPEDERRLTHADEELVTHADDVLAGRAGSPWRRVYPSRGRLKREPVAVTSHINQRHRR
jgi:PASTA domain